MVKNIINHNIDHYGDFCPYIDRSVTIENIGMTNYPIGPHRTQSDSTGPSRTPSDHSGPYWTCESVCWYLHIIWIFNIHAQTLQHLYVHIMGPDFRSFRRFS